MTCRNVFEIRVGGHLWGENGIHKSGRASGDGGKGTQTESGHRVPGVGRRLLLGYGPVNGQSRTSWEPACRPLEDKASSRVAWH